MRLIYLIALAVYCVSAMPYGASAQTTGNITVVVQDNFGQNVTGASQSCGGCSYSPSPPFSITNGSSGTFTAITDTTGGNQTSQTITRYDATKAGKDYGCQFTANNSYTTAPGSCPIRTPTAVSYAGVYPSPTCTVVSKTTPDPSTCNYSVTFKIAP